MAGAHGDHRSGLYRNEYRYPIAQRRNMRLAVLVFTLAAFAATAISGTFGAFLSKYAPVRGGATINLTQGE